LYRLRANTRNYRQLFKIKRQTIIEALYEHYKALVIFATPLTRDKGLAEDVVQDVYLQLLTSDTNRLLWIYAEGGGLNYLKKIVAVRVLSKKSQFYRKRIAYRKNKLNIDISNLEYLIIDNNYLPDLYKDKLKASINKALDKFDYYERNIFLLYYESKQTYNELAEETGIPKISIFNTVRKVKKQIKELVNVCTD
jgi:RNA polymerase sigma factor (sigma-70 family)